jgi:uncharacterized protein (TIGR01244 family)
MQAKPINETVTIADQPSEADLDELASGGYSGVVNLRKAGEPEQPLGPDEEGEKVRSLGLDYLHYPVGGEPLSEAGVESVLRFLDEHAPSRVLVHCRKGGRAAALVLIHQALARGWSPGEAVEKGREMGLAVDGNLRAMVEQYLAEHPGPGRAS